MIIIEPVFIYLKELKPRDFQNYFEMLFLPVTFSKFKHLQKVFILKHDYRNTCKRNQKLEFDQNKLNGCILAVAM